MTRAVVLGGGGVAGAAWETGVLLGLLDAGIDLGGADRIIGTSAGSRVGAELAGGVPVADSFARYLAPPAPNEITVAFDPETMVAMFGAAMAGAAPGIEMNIAIGRVAIATETVPEQVRRDLIAARLSVHHWTDRDLRIVAVDAAAGTMRVFTPTSGVELVDAVAASCAVPGVWPPVTIGDHRYIDGGMRSVINADLATGCDVVVVVAPMPELPIVAPDVAELAASLSRSAHVVTIAADEDSLAAFGSNPLDPASARPAALAGRVQAARHVDEVGAAWGAGG